MITQTDLDRFCCTEKYYFMPTAPWMKYTDGVKYLATNADAYWLLTAIASYQRKEPFQVWRLEVNEDKTAVLTMREDTGEPVLVEQEIKYTDFPLKEIKLWLINGVLILPSEY